MSYWKALRTHPGLLVAAALTGMGAVAGFNRGVPLWGALIGGGWAWACVLISNRGRAAPSPAKTEGKK